MKDIPQQGGFARSRNTGDNHQFPQGKGDVDSLQVVFPGAFDDDLLAVPHPSCCSGFYRAFSAEIEACETVGVIEDRVQGSLRGDPPAMFSRSGAWVYDVVGGPQGLLVVFHYDEGVPQIP